MHHQAEKSWTRSHIKQSELVLQLRLVIHKCKLVHSDLFLVALSAHVLRAYFNVKHRPYTLNYVAEYKVSLQSFSKLDATYICTIRLSNVNVRHLLATVNVAKHVAKPQRPSLAQCSIGAQLVQASKLYNGHIAMFH